MKKTLFLLSMICALELNAQNYYISFTGTGASTTVGSVKVENLTSGTSLTVNPGYRLSLTFPTGVNSPEDKQSTELNIYPNPTTGSSFFRVFPPESGEAAISVFDINGKSIYQVQSNLERALQEFRISGLNSGFYLVSVKGSRYQYSGKLVTNGEASGKISIEKISNSISVNEKSSKAGSKGSLNTNASDPTIDMIYTDGDRLKFTGISGIYSTVITDIPASDKTINFNFIACTDGDNNNYPVVIIGSQTWMAENLKTTKYNDGSTAIPNVTPDGTWSGLTTGAYSDYNNTPVNSTTYGRLYNWYTVDNNTATKVASNGGKNVCPTGWHIPTEAEWTTLTSYLGIGSGSKLKETGTTHWGEDVGNNETGYTALPGGYRYLGGFFSLIGSYGYWWSTDEAYPAIAYCRYMRSSSVSMYIENFNKHYGLSVRCLKD